VICLAEDKPGHFLPDGASNSHFLFLEHKPQL